MCQKRFFCRADSFLADWHASSVEQLETILYDAVNMIKIDYKVTVAAIKTRILRKRGKHCTHAVSYTHLVLCREDHILGGALFNEKEISLTDAPGLGIEGVMAGKIRYID